MDLRGPPSLFYNIDGVGGGSSPRVDRVYIVEKKKSPESTCGSTNSEWWRNTLPDRLK